MPEDDNGEEPKISEFTRRNMMWATGTAALSAGLAGCGGDGDGDTPTDTEDDGGMNTATTTPSGDVEIHSAVQWDWEPGDTNLSRWAPANRPTGQIYTFFNPLVTYSFGEQEFRPLLADGLPGINGCELVVNMKQDWEWWDGKPVTAEDRVYGHKLGSYMCCGGPDEVPWVAYFGENDYQFREQKIGPFNQEFRAENMRRPTDWKSDVVKPYFDRMEDASSDEEVNEVTEDLQNLQITLDDAIDGHGYGLWKPVSYSSSQITFEPFENHALYDNVEVDRWVWHVYGNEQTQTQAIKQGQIDVGVGNIFADIDGLPDSLEIMSQYEGLNGLKLAFNWRTNDMGSTGNRFLHRRPVRRAINYMMNQKGLAEIVNTGATAAEYQVGTLNNELIEKYLPESFRNNIIDYGSGEPMMDKANQVMRDAGFTKSGGRWQDEDGNKMSGLRFISTSSANVSQVGDTLAGLLDDFGIGTQYTAMENASFQERMDATEGTHEWDLALDTAGPNWPAISGVFNHFARQVAAFTGPSFILEQPENCGQRPPEAPVFYPKEDIDRTPKYGIPIDSDGQPPEFPRNVGDTDLSGDTYRFPMGIRQRQLRLVYERSKLREFAREIAWWANFHAPHSYLFSFDAALWMNTDKFKLRTGQNDIRTASWNNVPIQYGDIVPK